MDGYEVMSIMPAGIITQPVRLPNGMIYEVSHRHLGPLGKLMLIDERGGMRISAEAEQGDISDPAYLQRLQVLSQVVQIVLDALPGDNPPVPNLEEVIRRTAIYQRFLNVQAASEMKLFADALGLQEQELLFEVIADTISTTMQTRDIDETYGIVQRVNDLRHFLDGT
jgi:hypothetical protein